MMRVTPAMVSRQAWFMSRTFGRLVRDPALAHDLPRTFRTLASDPLSLRLPWLSFALIDLLEPMIGEKTHAFEFGGGGSTAWLADRGATVTTVEHDAAWLQRLHDELGENPRVRLEFRSTDNGFESYIRSVDSVDDESLDLIIVDGRERLRCFERSVSKIRPGGCLVLDDIDRRRYRPALDMIDWPRRVVVGFAPCKPSLGYSVVFTRPQAPTMGEVGDA